MYDRNGKLGKFIRGSISWNNEGRIILVFHPKLHKQKTITVSDNFVERNNILNSSEIQNIEFETLRKVIEVSDIIDILIKETTSTNKYKLYRVKNKKK